MKLGNIAGVFAGIASVVAVGVSDIPSKIVDGMLEHDTQRVAQDLNLIPYCVKVDADVLNARFGPGTDSSVLEQFVRGTVLSVAGRDNGWYEVPSSISGMVYVSPDHVNVSGECPEAEFTSENLIARLAL